MPSNNVMQPSAVVFWTRRLRLLSDNSPTGIGHISTPSAAAPGVIVSLLKITRVPRAHQTEMPVHRILIEADQEIQLVAVTMDLLVTDSHCEKYVAAAHDGLIGVVGIEMKPAANE